MKRAFVVRPSAATRAALVALAALLLAACGESAAAPAPSFTVAVFPNETPVEVRAAIPGQETTFLVAISNRTGGAGAASVTATATAAKVDRIVPASVAPGQVAEVWLTVDPAITAETKAVVSIRVSRGTESQTVVRSILVSPMSAEGRERDAQPHFEFWTRWLATNHPELAIGAAMQWRPVFVSTLLVVSHMSYFSDRWEMGLAWHAGTIPPYDWSEIYLRRRGDELKPSIAFRLDSFSNMTQPYAVAPPDVVVR